MIISWESVMDAEALHSGKSSVTLQRTDRHGRMGQKASDFQLSLWQRDTACATDCPPAGVIQKQCASSVAGEGPSRYSPRGRVVGNTSRPTLASTPGCRHPLHVWPHAWRWGRNAQRVFRPSSPRGARGVCAQRPATHDAHVGAHHPGNYSGLGAAGEGAWRETTAHRSRGCNLLAAPDAGVHGVSV